MSGVNIGRFEKAMKDAGYNQKQLADAVGTTPETICRYIKRMRIPDSYILWRIAKTLHVSMDYLMEGEKDE